MRGVCVCVCVRERERERERERDVLRVYACTGGCVFGLRTSQPAWSFQELIPVCTRVCGVFATSVRVCACVCARLCVGAPVSATVGVI